MGVILNLETASSVCSVALAVDGKLVALKESSEKNSHAGNITKFIGEVTGEVAMEYSQLDAIAVSKGPGSYTGLRIGVSTAKGLCCAIEKPLIAISTLQSMAFQIIQKSPIFSGYEKEKVLFCPMIDARRMEVYCALFDINNAIIGKEEAMIIDHDSFENELHDHTIIFFGDGAAKCNAYLSHQPNAVFYDDIHPSATAMIALSEGKFIMKEFEDVAYFEPFYLKEFVAGKPKVKGLS